MSITAAAAADGIQDISSPTVLPARSEFDAVTHSSIFLPLTKLRQTALTIAFRAVYARFALRAKSIKALDSPPSASGSEREKNRRDIDGRPPLISALKPAYISPAARASSDITATVTPASP